MCKHGMGKTNASITYRKFRRILWCYKKSNLCWGCEYYGGEEAFASKLIENSEWKKKEKEEKE